MHVVSQLTSTTCLLYSNEYPCKLCGEMWCYHSHMLGFRFMVISHYRGSKLSILKLHFLNCWYPLISATHPDSCLLNLCSYLPPSLFPLFESWQETRSIQLAFVMPFGGLSPSGCTSRHIPSLLPSPHYYTYALTHIPLSFPLHSSHPNPSRKKPSESQRITHAAHPIPLPRNDQTLRLEPMAPPIHHARVPRCEYVLGRFTWRKILGYYLSSGKCAVTAVTAVFFFCSSPGLLDPLQCSFMYMYTAKYIGHKTTPCMHYCTQVTLLSSCRQDWETCESRIGVFVYLWCVYVEIGKEGLGRIKTFFVIMMWPPSYIERKPFVSNDETRTLL